VSPELATDPVAESAPEKLAQPMKKKSVLVTGGAGFIGSNLVRRLLELKTDKVVVLDDLPPPANGTYHKTIGSSSSRATCSRTRSWPAHSNTGRN